MDDPARLAAWRCVQFNCHNGIWNEIGAKWCWKGYRNIHFGSLAFTLGREYFSKSLCRQWVSAQPQDTKNCRWCLCSGGQWEGLTLVWPDPLGLWVWQGGPCQLQNLWEERGTRACSEEMLSLLFPEAHPGSDCDDGDDGQCFLQCFLQSQWLSSRWFGTGGMMLAAPLHRDYGVRVTGASMSLWPGCSSCFLPSQDWNLLLLTDKSFCGENFLFI